MDIGFSGIIPKQSVPSSTPATGPGRTVSSDGPQPLFDGEALFVREAPADDSGRIREDAAEAVDEAVVLERKDALGQLVNSVLDLAPPDMPHFI